MGKSVSEAEVPDLDKPRIILIGAPKEDLLRNSVEDVAWQPTDHSKESKLLHVELRLSR